MMLWKLQVLLVVLPSHVTLVPRLGTEKAQAQARPAASGLS